MDGDEVMDYSGESIRFLVREWMVREFSEKKETLFLLLRPGLPADQNFLPFFSFLAKTCPKPPFGIPRAFQPAKTNIIIFLVIILFCIGSHSTYHIGCALSH